MDEVPILTGPTGVGKTDLSVRLALEVDAEIISADSRQIFRELEIGTAKPSPEILEAVPHHFVNERSLGEPFTAGVYQREAYERIADIRLRGRVPLVVGGSSLYLQALKEGLADIPNVPQTVRATLRRRLAAEGPDVLFDELVQVDPATAATMDPTKTQRMLRALEVFETTGRPLSSFHAAQEPPPYSFRTVVLHRDRKQLYHRINRRVDEMLERGLVEEARALLDSGYDLSMNPLRTIGYQEPVAFLRGEIPYDEMVRLIKRNTRRYAKRQLTWFRRDEENTWVDAGRDAAAVRADVSAILFS